MVIFKHNDFCPNLFRDSKLRTKHVAKINLLGQAYDMEIFELSVVNEKQNQSCVRKEI